MNFSRLKTVINSRGFAANFFALVSGSLVAQAITIIVSPILTRLYTSAEMGVYSNYVALLSILGGIACLQYDQAIILPEKDEDGANVFGLCLCVAGCVALLCAAIVIPLRKQIAALLKASSFNQWILLLPFSIFLAGANKALNFWNSRKRNLKRVAAASVVSTATSSGTQFALGLESIHIPGGMICGHLLGQGVAAFHLFVRMLREDWRYLYHHIHIGEMRAMGRRYKRFLIYSTPSALCDNAWAAMPSLLLAFFFGSSVSGYYALSFRTLSLPLSVIGGSLAQAFLPEAQRAKQANRLAKAAETMFHTLLRLGTTPLLLLAFVAPDLIALVFGKGWYISGEYIQWLSPWLLLSFLYSPMSNLFIVLERQREFMMLNIVALFMRLAALIGGGLLGDHMVAIALFGIQSAIMSLLCCCYAMNQVDISVGRVLLYIIQQVFHSLLYVIPIIPVLILVGNGIWSVSVAVLSGCAFLLLEGKTILRTLRKNDSGDEKSR